MMLEAVSNSSDILSGGVNTHEMKAELVVEINNEMGPQQDVAEEVWLVLMQHKLQALM